MSILKWCYFFLGRDRSRRNSSNISPKWITIKKNDININISNNFWVTNQPPYPHSEQYVSEINEYKRKHQKSRRESTLRPKKVGLVELNIILITPRLYWDILILFCCPMNSYCQKHLSTLISYYVLYICNSYVQSVFEWIRGMFYLYKHHNS